MQSDSQEKLVYLVIVLQIKLNISNVGYFFQIFLKHNFNSELLSGYIFKKNRDICKKKCSSNHLALAFRMGCLLGFFFFFLKCQLFFTECLLKCACNNLAIQFFMLIEKLPSILLILQST